MTGEELRRCVGDDCGALVPASMLRDGKCALCRRAARDRAENPKWEVHTDPETGDFRVLYNGAGKAIRDVEIAWIELELWGLAYDGEVKCVGFTDDGDSLWEQAG